MHRYGIWLGALLLALVNGCASSRVVPAGAEVLVGKSARFVFAAHRQLELETCGCTLAQLGGVDREFNFLQEMKKQAASGSPVFLLSAGRTFFPRADSRIPRRFIQTKRETLVEALNLLGLTALGFSAYDAGMPPPTAALLAKAAHFPILSTNLAPKDASIPWKTHHWLEVRGKKLLVASLTRPAPGTVLAMEWVWREPKVALEALLKEQAADFVVLLSDLPYSENESLAREFKSLRLVMGDSDLDSTPTDSGLLLASHTLFTNSLSSGRGLSWVEPELDRPGAFFNRPRTESQKMYVAVLKSRLQEGPKASRLAARKELKLQENYPVEYLDGMARYNAGAERLTPELAAPTNRLTKLVQDFHARYRELALDSDH